LRDSAVDFAVQSAGLRSPEPSCNRRGHLLATLPSGRPTAPA